MQWMKKARTWRFVLVLVVPGPGAESAAAAAARGIKRPARSISMLRSPNSDAATIALAAPPRIVNVNSDDLIAERRGAVRRGIEFWLMFGF